jgi:diguanylate cyclase (GGDEF)-like protein
MSSPRLPTLPRVAFRILELVQSPDVSMAGLSDAIAADPALAAKILKTANSGIYGRVRGVARLKDALMILGLRNVKTLSLGFSLVSDLSGAKGSGLDYTLFWRRSIVAACAARAISSHLNRDQSDEAFLGGLMHCIGVVALDRALGPAYRPIASHLGDGFDTYLELEQCQLGLQHPEVGTMLAAGWNLPPALAACISHYADPSAAPAEYRRLVSCVALGARCGDIIAASEPGAALTRFREAAAGFELDDADAEALLTLSLEHAAALQQVFEGPTADLIIPSEILARANDALLDLNLEYAQENTRLETEKQDLVRDAYTDSLTALANRRHFDQYLAQQFEIARRYGAPLSLLIVDIDHFKRINDVYGHPVGDAVLRHIAGCIRAAVRASDFAARYGGEEFGIVLPASGPDGARRSAERIRLAVADEPTIAPGGFAISATVSVGVATFAGNDAGGVEGLVWAADRALYTAKLHGRNLVQAA